MYMSEVFNSMCNDYRAILMLITALRLCIIEKIGDVFKTYW